MRLEKRDIPSREQVEEKRFQDAKSKFSYFETKGGDKVKKEVSPAVMWGILIAVGLVVVVIGFKMLVPSSKIETKGSETDMSRVKAGEPLYQPPANAPVPRAPTNGAGQGGGGYNLTPPPR